MCSGALREVFKDDKLRSNLHVYWLLLLSRLHSAGVFLERIEIKFTH
jgi:hypothetical protein